MESKGQRAPQEPLRKRWYERAKAWPERGSRTGYFLAALAALAFGATAPVIRLAGGGVGPLLTASLLYRVMPDRGTLVSAALFGFGVYLHVTERHGHVHDHHAVTHEHVHRHDDEHHEHHHDSPIAGEHSHEHRHEAVSHEHEHAPDVHHEHRHGQS